MPTVHVPEQVAAVTSLPTAAAHLNQRSNHTQTGSCTALAGALSSASPGNAGGACTTPSSTAGTTASTAYKAGTGTGTLAPARPVGLSPPGGAVGLDLSASATGLGHSLMVKDAGLSTASPAATQGPGGSSINANSTSSDTPSDLSSSSSSLSKVAMPAVMLRGMRAEDLGQAIWLHQAARLRGRPVFGTGQHLAGIRELLECAASSTHGVQGWVALPLCGSSPLGVMTAQTEDMEEDNLLLPGPAEAQAAGQGQLLPGPAQQLVLLTLVVAPEAQGKGVAQALVAELINTAGVNPRVRRLVSDVASGNTPALRALLRAGFNVDRAPPSFRIPDDGSGAGQGQDAQAPEPRRRGPTRNQVAGTSSNRALAGFGARHGPSKGRSSDALETSDASVELVLVLPGAGCPRGGPTNVQPSARSLGPRRGATASAASASVGSRPLVTATSRHVYKAHWDAELRTAQRCAVAVRGRTPCVIRPQTALLRC
ncbi:hypothetical protein QJQ45_018933 [Haematococcus lacustris]|nr:hypothetical protein QJQ45_018933 [Haematococcus lacustris]